MKHAMILLGFVVLGLFVFISTFVWLPDIPSKREVRLAELVTQDGDAITIAQTWNDDGYITEFVPR